MLKQLEYFYEFGPFRFIPEQNLLLRDGKHVPLTSKAIEILYVLIRNSGYIVEKDELMKEVWPDSIVEESNLTQNISVLRRGLGETRKEPQYIETVPRRGYRFIAAVKKVPARGADLFLGPHSEIGSDDGKEDVNVKVEATQQGSVGASGVAASNVEESFRADQELIQPSEEASTGPAMDSGRLKVEFMRRPSGVALILIVPVISAVIIGIVYGSFKLINRSRFNQLTQSAKTPAPFHEMKIARLTTTGRAFRASISPDGKYAAYIEEERGKRSLWVREIANTSSLQIIPPTESNLDGLAFSRDGNYIYYFSPAQNGARTLYQIPVSGGIAKEVLQEVHSNITVAPDGKRFAFIRRSPDQSKRALIVANMDGSGAQELTVRTLPEYFTVGGLAWSPDGSLIACVVGDLSAAVQMNVVAVSVADGSVRPITLQSMSAITGLCWLPDGTGLLIAATDKRGRLFRQIWRISYPDGQVQRVTNDLSNYEQLSLSADGQTLLALHTDMLMGIRAKRVNEGAGEARELRSGKFDGLYGLSWTPDGKVVYTSYAGGSEDIWVMDADGGNQKQLTRNTYINISPSVCPDGRNIVFMSDRTGTPHIWVMSIDGGDQRQLTNGYTEEYPACSADGKTVVYQGYDVGTRTIWKIPIEGGEPTRLTDGETQMPAISPDGSKIAFYYREAGTTAPWVLGVIPVAGGLMKRYDPPVPLNPSHGPLRWTADGRALTYLDHRGGTSNIWALPLGDGRPVQLTDFKSDYIYSFDWSRDGKQLVCARGIDINDVVLISR